MSVENVIVVNILKEVAASMQVPGIDYINYEPGTTLKIIETLLDDNKSTTFKDKKYPLIAVLFPIREVRGTGYYSDVKVDRIAIATLTRGTDRVMRRYEDGGTFLSILYPCYYEFLRRLAYHKNVINGDPDNFPHTKMDNPGSQPVGQGLIDYIDSIDILNLEFTLSQIKNC